MPFDLQRIEALTRERSVARGALCMTMRGVEKQDPERATAAVLRPFRAAQATREECLGLNGARG